MDEHRVTVRVTRGKPRLSTEFLSGDEPLIEAAMDAVFKAFKLKHINEEPVEWSLKMVAMYVDELEKRNLVVTVYDPRTRKENT